MAGGIKMLYNIIFLSFPIVAVAIATIVAKNTMQKTRNVKRSLKFNFSSLVIMSVLFTIFGITAAAEPAVAGEAVAVAGAVSNGAGIAYIAAGLCTGITGIGAGIALSSAVPAAIGAVSEDPKAFGKSLIFVALGETIALYGIVISVMIISKL